MPQKINFNVYKMRKEFTPGKGPNFIQLVQHKNLLRAEKIGKQKQAYLAEKPSDKQCR